MIEYRSSLDPKDFLGDLQAPEGSALWARGVRFHLQKDLEDYKANHASIRSLVRRLIDCQGFCLLTDPQGRSFASFEAFSIYPVPHGLGRDPREIDAIIKEREAQQTPQAMAGSDAIKPLLPKPGAPKGSHNNPNGAAGKQGTKDDNVTFSSLPEQEAVSAEVDEDPLKEDKPPSKPKKGSNSASYLIRRLKRDFPEIADALARGEYPSARAAAIAAGIIKVADPVESVKKQLRKLTVHEQREVLAWLKKQVAGARQETGR